MRLGAAIACLVLLQASAASGEDVSILCRNYTSSYNIDFLPIGINAANWLTGLSYPGEYTQYSFTIGGFGTDRCELYAMGADGVPYRVTMTLTGAWSSEVQVINFDFIGSGFEG